MTYLSCFLLLSAPYFSIHSTSRSLSFLNIFFPPSWGLFFLKWIRNDFKLSYYFLILLSTRCVTPPQVEVKRIKWQRKKFSRHWGWGFAPITFWSSWSWCFFDKEDTITLFSFLSLLSFAQAKTSEWALCPGIQIREDHMFTWWSLSLWDWMLHLWLGCYRNRWVWPCILLRLRWVTSMRKKGSNSSALLNLKLVLYSKCVLERERLPYLSRSSYISSPPRSVPCSPSVPGSYPWILDFCQALILYPRRPFSFPR